MADDEDECMLDHDSDEGEDGGGGWPSDLAAADGLTELDGDLLSPSTNLILPAPTFSHWEHQVPTNSRHSLPAGVGLQLGYYAGLEHSREEDAELLHFDSGYGSEPNVEPLGQVEGALAGPATSYLPLLLDDDLVQLACARRMDGSRSTAAPLSFSASRPTLALAPARCTEHARPDADADDAALRRFSGVHTEPKGDDIVAGESMRTLGVRSPDGDDRLPPSFSAFSWF